MKDEEKKEDDLHSQTENIMKKIQEQMKLTEDALNSVQPDDVSGDNASKSMLLPKMKKDNKNKRFIFRIRQFRKRLHKKAK